MGRYKNGINGPFNGKIGHAVGVNWRGLDVIRSLPTPSTRPPTEKQLIQRYIFALVCEWLKPLRELINIGYQLYAGVRTPMNGAVSFHLKSAITGTARDLTIDYAKAVFSIGALLVSFVKEVLMLMNGRMVINWQSTPESVFCKQDDQATVVVYNPEKQQFVTFQNVAERSGGTVELQLPAHFKTDVVHAWMHWVRADGKAVSTTVYLGVIIVHL